MKRQWVIALSFLIIGIAVPWLMLMMAIMVAEIEHEELEPGYILAALVVTMLAFGIAFLARQACKRVVLGAQVRRAREARLPAAQMSLVLATYAALDQGQEAGERLREALGLVAAGRPSPEAKDRLCAVTDSVTKDLAAARRELDDLSRERSPRRIWL